MFGTVMGDLGGALMGVVDGAALTTLIVLGAVVGFKGIRTQTLPGVFGHAAAALVLMLVLLYVANGVLAPERFSLAHWGTYTEQAWGVLMTTTGKTVVGYYMAALVGVAIVFAVKQLLHRHR